MKKGKRDRYSSFVGLERRLFSRDREGQPKCPEFRQLSPRAVVLYLYLKAKFNGSNNGQIAFHYSEIKGANGYRSPKSIAAAIRELEAAGWIERTRFGGLYRFQNLYRLTGRFDGFGV